MNAREFAAKLNSLKTELPKRRTADAAIRLGERAVDSLVARSPIRQSSAVGASSTAWVRAGISTPVVYAIVLGVAAWTVWEATIGFPDYHMAVFDTISARISLVMVFFILNGQNRDTAALQAKADEEIRATEGARNELVGIEKRESANGIDEIRLTPEECDDCKADQ